MLNIERNNGVMIQHIISLQQPKKLNPMATTSVGEFLKGGYNLKLKGTIRNKIEKENSV